MKQKLNRALSALLLPVLVVLMCSCTVFDVFSVDSLIRAPKLTGENAAIQQAFEKAVGSEISLVNPLFGTYRSAYVLYDYDHDDIDEAVVFYSRNDNPEEIRLNVLDCEDKKWYSVYDTAGNGSEIYKVDFVNLDRESDDEIAVTWTLSDSKRSKTLSLYKLVSGGNDAPEKVLSQLAAVQMIDYTVCDIDYDGQNEVFYTYATLDGNSTLFNAAIFRMDAQTMSPLPLSDVGISKNIDQIIGFKSDIKDAVYTIYIDCIATDGRYFTEILSYDYSNNALVRPLDSDGRLLTERTFRYDDILCADKNGDYMIDIPVQTEYPGSHYEDENGQTGGALYITSYMQLSDGELICTAKYYRNNYCGYSIRIDDFWEETYVIYNAQTGSTQFRLLNSSEEDDLIFTLSVNEDDDSDEKILIGVTALGKSLGFSAEKLMHATEEI